MASRGTKLRSYFLFLFPLQHVKRPALQNKQVVVLRMAFRAGKVLVTFEKRAPGLVYGPKNQTFSKSNANSQKINSAHILRLARL